MGSKAQISAEFFIFVGLAFLIAIAFEVASLNQLEDFRKQKENEAIEDLALKLQKELLVAAVVEDGYVRGFSIPDKLDSINYSIKMQNFTLTLQSRNSMSTVLIPRSIGNFTKGANKLNKTGGVIRIN